MEGCGGGGGGLDGCGRECEGAVGCVGVSGVGSDHTLSISFRHLPPNSARTGYALKRALFISEQLSTDAVSALRKVWVLI